jgi:hypothetical protein
MRQADAQPKLVDKASDKWIGKKCPCKKAFNTPNTAHVDEE